MILIHTPKPLAILKNDMIINLRDEYLIEDIEEGQTDLRDKLEAITDEQAQELWGLYCLSEDEIDMNDFTGTGGYDDAVWDEERETIINYLNTI
mgnify:CR=1 FL=1